MSNCSLQVGGCLSSLSTFHLLILVIQALDSCSVSFLGVKAEQMHRRCSSNVYRKSSGAPAGCVGIALNCCCRYFIDKYIIKCFDICRSR